MTIRTKTLLHAALLLGAGVGLSGCVYDLGLSFASDGYYDDGYGCDPYGGYDDYYNCDYGQGFSNIGFGGGWYDNYYYPGYGIFLFDNVGRRYPMRDQYRRYWGEKRHNWYREHRGDRREGSRYDGRPNRYNDGVTPRRTGWPDRQSGRAQDGNTDKGEGRVNGRRDRNEQWPGRDGRDANAAPVSNADRVQGAGRSRDNADGFGRPDKRGDATAAKPPPRQQTVQQDAVAPRTTPLPQVAPIPRPERPDPARRQGRHNGGAVRDE